MLGAGGCPPPPTKPSTLRRLPSAANIFPLLSSIQIFQSDFLGYQLSFPSSPLSLSRSGFCLFAQNKHRNGGGRSANAAVLETEGFEEEEEEEFDVEYNDDDNEDDDVDEVDGGDDSDDLDVIVPVDELDDWLQRKPRGFGEGKVYDTSTEDKLLEEIEQSRRAQLANINKLRSLSSEPKKQLNIESEAVPVGACVRISQLPKKKNIQRDLKTAFKGIPGIVNITPVVSGNKKTKDPVCKGLAFVNFKSLEDAKRLIDVFSTQNVTFGKVDKQIKCELLNSTYNDNDPNVEGEKNADSDQKNVFNFEEPCDSDSDSDSDSEVDDIDRIERKMKSLAVSPPSKRKDIPQVKVKSVGRTRKNKITAPKVPGAAKRLKQREKAMLADVFTRYGSKVASSSKES